MPSPFRIARHVVTAVIAAACVSFTGNPDARGDLLVSLDFNDLISAAVSTTQYQTGSPLVYSATFGGWDNSGYHATHAVQLSGAAWGGPGDYAIMIYGDNVVTQKVGFAANEAGKTYYMSYLMGPTVYAEPSQATQAGDTFRVNLLRSDDTVLAFNDVAPGAWAGVQTFSMQYFSYVGDGSGPIKMQLLSGNTLTRFAGAIDGVAIWDSIPAVPEIDPAGLGSVLALVSGVLALVERRRA